MITLLLALILIVAAYIKFSLIPAFELAKRRSNSRRNKQIKIDIAVNKGANRIDLMRKYQGDSFKTYLEKYSFARTIAQKIAFNFYNIA